MLHCLSDKREKEGDWQTQVGGGRSSEVKKKKEKRDEVRRRDRVEENERTRQRGVEIGPEGQTVRAISCGNGEWVDGLWRRWAALGGLKASSLPHFQFHLPFYSSEVIISFISSEKCESSDFSGSPGCRSPALTDTISASEASKSTGGQCFCIVMTRLIKKDGPVAALLSITRLITPSMMKESRSNLVIAKILMPFWFGAAPAGCEV